MIKFYNNKALNEFVQRLRERFRDRIDSVILFGSHARGEGKEDSDIDVLVIGDVKLDEVIEIAYPIFLKYGVYISPIVMSRDHFEMLKLERSGFAENVLKEGVVLYGRA